MNVNNKNRLKLQRKPELFPPSLSDGSALQFNSSQSIQLTKIDDVPSDSCSNLCTVCKIDMSAWNTQRRLLHSEACSTTKRKGKVKEESLKRNASSSDVMSESCNSEDASKPAVKRVKKDPKLINVVKKALDEDLQMALAMSRSIVDEQKRKTIAEKKGDTLPLNLMIDKDKRQDILAERLANFILIGDHGACDPTPRLKEPSSDVRVSHLWERTALIEPANDEAERSDFYVADLKPSISPAKTHLGDNGFGPSQIPGREATFVLSQDGDLDYVVEGNDEVKQNISVVLSQGFLPEKDDNEEIRGASGTSANATRLGDDGFESRSVLSSFLSMVNNPAVSDLRIQLASGEIVFAHKFVFLAHGCSMQYQDTESTIVLFEDFNKEAVIDVLRYLYGGVIPASKSSWPLLAEKWNIQQLLKEAGRRQVTHPDHAIILDCSGTKVTTQVASIQTASEVSHSNKNNSSEPWRQLSSPIKKRMTPPISPKVPAVTLPDDVAIQHDSPFISRGFRSASPGSDCDMFGGSPSPLLNRLRRSQNSLEVSNSEGSVVRSIKSMNTSPVKSLKESCPVSPIVISLIDSPQWEGNETDNQLADSLGFEGDPPGAEHSLADSYSEKSSRLSANTLNAVGSLLDDEVLRALEGSFGSDIPPPPGHSNQPRGEQISYDIPSPPGHSDQPRREQISHQFATPTRPLKTSPKKTSMSIPSPFTPMPKYDAMKTPELKNALSSYGVRPLAKKKAILMLKEIYKETHQYETDTEPESGDMSSSNESSSSQSSQDNFLERVGALEESLLVGEDDEEEVSLTQRQRNKKDSAIDVMDFIKRDPELHETVLCYEPLELDVFHASLKTAGIKIGLKRLMDFLDDQCITFTVRKREKQPGKNRQRRKPKMKKT